MRSYERYTIIVRDDEGAVLCCRSFPTQCHDIEQIEEYARKFRKQHNGRTASVYKHEGYNEMEWIMSITGIKIK